MGIITCNGIVEVSKRSKEVKRLERIANDERTSTSERLATIYRIYRESGIEIPGYIENGEAI